MACLSPEKIKQDGAWVTVPCGTCAGCLSKRRSDWMVRIRQELENAETAYFITLTYDDDNLRIKYRDCEDVYTLKEIIQQGFEDDAVATLYKRDLQLFIKKLRKKTDAKIRYYAVGEYGTKTERPHYHILLFNYPAHLVDTIDTVWAMGNIKVGEVNGASINYVTKYMIDDDEIDVDRQDVFTVMSRKPGIGAAYLKDEIIEYHQRTLKDLVRIEGDARPMPRYYRDKIFDEEDKLKIKLRRENQTIKDSIKDDHRLATNYQSYGEGVLQEKEQFTKNVKRKSKRNKEL